MAFLSAKKLKKLKENPRAFFVDAFKKKAFPIKNALKRLKPKKKQGFAKYAIVSAVYNVEKYLDDYFKSIINQRLDFKNNILIICVDDGSTDNSAKIIKKYQKNFPQNIIYLHKENGGQASARNLGLRFLQQLQDSGATSSLRGEAETIHAENGKQRAESGNLDCHDLTASSLAMTAQIKAINPKFKDISWVTFTDPDDFLDRDYFYEVDKFLKKHKDEPVKMISCNISEYKSLVHRSNTQCIASMMRKSKVSERIDANATFFFANATFFFASATFFFASATSGLKFSEKCKPHYEDGKFMAEFIFHLTPESKVAAVKESLYHYRKNNNDSTLSKANADKRNFLVVPKEGWLAVLKEAKERFNKVPDWLENTILWELFWTTQQLIGDQAYNARVLNKTEQKEFLSLLDECFSYISTQTILSKNFYGYFQKLGYLHCFKKEKIPFRIIEFIRYDKVFNEFQLYYYTYDPNEKAEFLFDGEQGAISYEQTKECKILERVFLYEKLVFVKVPPSGHKFEVFLDGKRANIEHKKIYYRQFFFVERFLKGKDA